MSVLNRYYFTLPEGQSQITSAKIANVNISGLKRSGKEYSQIEIAELWTSMQFKKPFSSSTIYFDPANPGNPGSEIVWVLTDGEGPAIIPPPEPEPEVIAGRIDNGTFPLTGNSIDAVTYDGDAVTVGSVPAFGSFSFPVTSTNATCLFKVMNTGVNKNLEITITATLRQLIVIDSAGSSQTLNNVNTGSHTFNNVTIDGITECRIIMN